MIKQRAPRCRIGYSRARNKVYKMDSITFHYKHDFIITPLYTLSIYAKINNVSTRSSAG